MARYAETNKIAILKHLNEDVCNKWYAKVAGQTNLKQTVRRTVQTTKNGAGWRVASVVKNPNAGLQALKLTQ
jgi:hypothetical protein